MHLAKELDTSKLQILEKEREVNELKAEGDKMLQSLRDRQE